MFEKAQILHVILCQTRSMSASALFKVLCVWICFSVHISSANAKQPLQSEFSRQYSIDEVRRAYAENTHIMHFGPEEYPKATLYRREIYRLLAWPDRELRWNFTERDWEILESAPDHDDAAFIVPAITEQKALCRTAFDITYSSRDTQEKAVALARLMNTAVINDRQRLEVHYENLLSRLSENARGEIVSRAQFPAEAISIPVLKTDQIGVAETLPDYYRHKVFVDCLEVVDLSLFDVAQSSLIAGKVPDYSRPPAPRGSITKRFSTPGAVYDGESLKMSVIRSTTPHYSLVDVSLSPLSNNQWVVDSVNEVHRLKAVKNIYVHPNFGRGEGQIVVQGTLELDTSRCEKISEVTVDYHEDTRAIYEDFFKDVTGSQEHDGDCTHPLSIYSFHVVLPTYGFDEGWYQLIINDDEAHPVLLPNDDVIPEHVNATVISPYSGLSKLKSDAVQVPTVMMPDLAGAYQGAEFRPAAANEWALVKLAEPDLLDGIENVEVVKTGNRPIQALIRVQGQYQATCTNVKVVSRFREEDKVIEVNFFSDHGTSESCNEQSQAFDLVYPVSLLDVEEGTYQVQVNNEHHVSLEVISDETQAQTYVTGDFIPRINCGNCRI